MVKANNAMTDWNPEHPLTRMKGETAKANAALNDYALMGNGRSLAKLHQTYIKPTSENPPTRNLRTLAGWSSRYEWQARVAAWQKIQQARELEMWQQRRAEWRERSFQVAQKLIEKAERMLDFPLARRVARGDQTVIEPADWSFFVVPQLASTADRLARLAADMETDTTRHVGEESRPIKHKFDLSEVPIDVLHGLVTQEGPPNDEEE